MLVSSRTLLSPVFSCDERYSPQRGDSSCISVCWFVFIRALRKGVGSIAYVPIRFS